MYLWGMATKFKYQIGDPVWNTAWDEIDYVIQKRVEHGRPYYRLKHDPVIRHEDQLLGEPTKKAA